MLLSCIVIILYLFMVLLWLFYADAMNFFSCIYIWIENIYDSDDLLLTQMVLQGAKWVNTEDKYTEDEEDDEN